MRVLLSKEEITSEISKITKGKNVICAVAFLGGASDRLFKGNECNVTVICDLLSGSTNPIAIKRMIENKINIFKMSKLHAKVYYSSAGCIIGSANASTNGLALEGDTLNGTVEACVLITDKAELSKVHAWLNESILGSESTTRISSTDLKTAYKNWIPRRRLSLTGNHGFVDSLKSHRLSDVDLFLAIYRKEASDEAIKDFLTQAKKFRYDKAKEISELDFYEDWTALKPDYDVIDIHYYTDGVLEYGGVFRIKDWEHSFSRNDGSTGTITFCEKIKEGTYFRMSKNDKKWLSNTIQNNSNKIFKNSTDAVLIPIEKFIRDYVSPGK